jgi:hypothetical protein
MISASAGNAARRINSKMRCPPLTFKEESRSSPERKQKERFGGYSGDKVVN